MIYFVTIIGKEKNKKETSAVTVKEEKSDWPSREKQRKIIEVW